MAQETYDNPDLLWSAEQLKAQLDNPNLTLLDVRSTHEVMQGIVKGAAHFDVYGVGLEKTTQEVWPAFINMIRSLLALRGCSPKRSLCIYEQNQTGLKAARAFWLLEYMGCEDVHVLDGGIKAWQEAGYETVRDMTPPKPQSFAMSLKEAAFIDADALNAALAEDICVLDTRSDDEYYGRNKRGGPRGGTIPGAVHLEWLQYLDEKGKMKPASALSALFEKNGIVKNKKIVPF